MAPSNSNHSVIDLSIIIISYNTRQVTLNCLNTVFTSLKQAGFRYEVLVIDNASTDGSFQTIIEFGHMLQNDFNPVPMLQIVSNKENVGFGRANNQAAKLAKGNHLLFLNSDTEVLADGISNLYHYYTQNHNKIHFLGGKLLNKDRTPQPSCGPFYTPWVVFAALFLKGDYWGLTRYSPDQPRRVDWVSGACILTTREIFQKLGGFDEKIFMYMEEIDLLYRAKNQMYTTWFYPAARFIHLGSVSSGGRSYPIIQVYRGFLYFYQQHYSPFSMLLLRSMLQLKAVVSIIIGRLTNNKYLLETYEQAYKIASVDR